MYQAHKKLSIFAAFAKNKCALALPSLDLDLASSIFPARAAGPRKIITLRLAGHTYV